MKALTLWRPWAWAMFHGKDVENRTWAPPAWLVGQKLVIHAGQRYDKAGDQLLLENLGRLPPRPRKGFTGTPYATGIIGVVTVERVIIEGRGMDDPMHYSPWFSGPVGWVCGAPQELPDPIPCKGRQGLWDVPDDIAVKINEALSLNAGDTE